MLIHECSKALLIFALMQFVCLSPFVFADEILLGQSAAFTGPSAKLGVELWRGAQAYFNTVNAQGGINGHVIRVVTLDDRYMSDLSLPNTIELIEKHKVFALFGYVGTPTLVKALPVILQYGREQDLFLFSNFTGAQPQRQIPYFPYVFNVRASYEEELEAQVDHLYSLGKRNFGLFIQDDAYGRSGSVSAEKALKKRGLSPTLEVTYHRGATRIDSMSEQAKLLHEAKVDVVISVGAYGACSAFIRDMRLLDPEVVITNVSFVGSSALLQALGELKKESKRDITNRLIISQVIPYFENQNIPIVREYRNAMNQFKEQLEEQIPSHYKKDPGYKPDLYTFSGMEGFVNAKIFSEFLRHVHGKITRKAFIKVAENLPSIDIGLPEEIKFSSNAHQSLHRIYFTTIEDNQFKTIGDSKQEWERFR